MKYFIFYILLISAISVILVVYDKTASKKWPRSRVPEANLILLAILGGCAAMYISMRLIRHKTLHKKFMIGLPVIFVCQLIASAAVYFWAFPLLFK